MFEDSTEGFLARWRRHAAPVHIYSRVEGSPLVECRVGGAILQLLERSGPYEAPPGDGSAIVNVTAASVRLTEDPTGLEATGIGRAHGCGEVVRREDPFLVVDAGAPLLLSVEDPIGSQITVGSRVEFDAHPPMHFFVVRETRAPVSSSSDNDAP